MGGRASSFLTIFGQAASGQRPETRNLTPETCLILLEQHDVFYLFSLREHIQRLQSDYPVNLGDEFIAIAGETRGLAGNIDNLRSVYGEDRVHGRGLNSLSRRIQNDSVYLPKCLMRFGDFLSNIAFHETAIRNAVSARVLLSCID